jgi:hypothetical protein
MREVSISALGRTAKPYCFARAYRSVRLRRAIHAYEHMHSQLWPTVLLVLGPLLRAGISFGSGNAMRQTRPNREAI